MKTNLKKILIISLILIAALMIFLPRVIEADGSARTSEYQTTFKEFMTNDTWKPNRSKINPLGYEGYDDIMNLSPSEIFNYLIDDSWSWYSDWKDYYYEGGVKWWEREPQVMCLEGAVIASGSGISQPCVVIDINEDGTKPGEATVYSAMGTRETGDNKWNAIIACYAAKCEEVGHLTNSTGAYSYKKGFSYLWNNGYRSFMSSYASPLPGYSSSSASNSFVTEAKEYGENYQSASSTYQARIIICKGGGGQARAILYGKGAETKVKIDKYITELKDSAGTRTPAEDRSNRTDSWKKENAEEVAEKDTEITYKIVITNESSTEIKVKYIDDYSDGGVFTHVSGDTEKLITLGPKGGGNDKEEITLVLKYTSDNTTGDYENKAIIKSEDESKTLGHSSDWITLKIKPKIKLDKYVTYAASEEGEKTFPAEYDDDGNLEEDEWTVTQTAFTEDLGDSRADREDDDKEADPVHLGYNIGMKTVIYRIVITNIGTSDVTGYLSDYCQLSGGTGGTYTIKAGESETVEFTAYLYSGCTAKKYRNRAVFRVGYLYEWESSDWVIVDDCEIQWGATLEKSITKVSTPGQNATDDNGGSEDVLNTTNFSYRSGGKDSAPAEVVQGSEVTFTVKATNYTWYKNKSDKNHAGRKDPRINEHYADMTFYDMWDQSEFELVSCSASYVETTKGLKFSFKDIPYGSSATVEITLRVLVDNMHLANLKNEAEGVELAVKKHYYQHYDVPMRYDPRTVTPTYYDSEGNLCYYYNDDGTIYSYEVYDIPIYSYDHTGEPDNYPVDGSCRFLDTYTEHEGKVECYDYDCCRVLDPIVAGMVFFDKNKDGLKDAGEDLGELNNGETGQYYLAYPNDWQDITVELWNADTKTRVAGPLPINLLDGSTGEFSFGRVRKGRDYSGSKTTRRL